MVVQARMPGCHGNFKLSSFGVSLADRKRWVTNYKLEMQQSGRSNLLDAAAAFLTDFVPPCIYGLCQVCGAEATGIHYAASTCEGCKGFFKRSLPVYRSYKCFFGGNCHIIPETRGRCKACRFQKCLQAGMSPDGNRNRGKGKSIIQLDAKSAGTSTGPQRQPLRPQQKLAVVPAQEMGLSSTGLYEGSFSGSTITSYAGNHLPSTLMSSGASLMPSMTVAAGTQPHAGRHPQESLQRQAVYSSDSFRQNLHISHRNVSGVSHINSSDSSSGAVPASSSLSPLDDVSERRRLSTMHASSSMGTIFNYAVSPRQRHMLTSSHTSNPFTRQEECSPPVVIASGRAFDQQQNSSISPLSLHAVTPNADVTADINRQNDISSAEPPQRSRFSAHVMLPLQRQLAISGHKSNSIDGTDDQHERSVALINAAGEEGGALNLKINQLIDSFDSVVCSSIVCHLYTEWANQWMPNLLTARYNKHFLGNNLLYQPVVSISHYMGAFMKAVTEYDDEMERYAVAVPGMKALDAHVGYELRSHSCLATFCVTFCEVLSEEESYYAFQCQDGDHSHWLSQTNYWFSALTPAGALPIFWHMTAYFRSLKLNDVVRALVVAAVIARSRGNDHLPAFVRSALPVTYFGHFKVEASEWAPAEQVFSFLLNVISSHLSREYPDRHEYIMRNLHYFFSELALKLDVLDELMLQSIPFGFNDDGTFDWQRLLRFNLNDDIIPMDVRRWLRSGWELVN